MAGVWLTDFGAQAGTDRFGTLDYMAPEQRRGDPVDGRADLFALGLILFELLTGERPQPGDTLVARRPGLPAGLQPLFERLFTHRDRREADAGALARALDAVLAAER